MKRRVAILISGRGSNMSALIRAAAAPDFPAEISLVIANKPFGKDRAGFEAVLQAALDQHGIELICLGGFMRLFTAEFTKSWYGRMLKIEGDVCKTAGSSASVNFLVAPVVAAAI